ncbi:hypothetical protein ACYJW8_14550 [Frateuria aurantia]
MKKTFFALLTCSLLAACATTGQRVDASQIRPGMTMQAVEAKFGEPQATQGNPDGTTVLQYTLSSTKMGLGAFVPFGHGPKGGFETTYLEFDQHQRFVKS